MKNNSNIITPQYYNFLMEVAANNNRDWFKAHKEQFDVTVFLPFKVLTETVIEKMQRIDSKIQINFKQAAFRFYRDTRFSPDKSPYKLWMGAAVSRIGRKNTKYPELYFQFGPGENFIATGIYRPDKDTLYHIRSKIAENPEEFEAVIKDKTFLKMFPDGIQGERNKRLPVKAWQQLAEKHPVILNKQFFAVNFYRPEYIIRPGLADFIVAHYKATEVFNQWLLNLY
jgi:uncharacterized protein (TIGR02453 family)